METGLVFLDVAFIKATNLIGRYNWPQRRAAPTPEVVLHRCLLNAPLAIANWKAWRADKVVITNKNIVSLDLDWVTHCHTDAWAYDRFVEAALSPKPERAKGRNLSGDRAKTGCCKRLLASRRLVAAPLLKLNFGCGSNKLPGWRNMDAEIDITKPLPFKDGEAAFIEAGALRRAYPL